jgi:predicted dehydrogenase
MAELKVGIVGYGRFGRFLHRAWGPSVVAVCDSRQIQTIELPTRIYRDHRAVLDDREVSVVSVATEPSSHAAIAVQALEAGKHVIVEKPLALTMEDARRVMDAAGRTGRQATVDHVLRHHPLVRSLETVTGEGLLGVIRSFSVTNYAIAEHLTPGHWFWDPSRSGGILVEHGVHFFDLAARLAGTAVREITGFFQRTEGRADGVAAVVLHEGGAIANHFHAFCRTIPGERAVIDVGFEHGNVSLTGWIPLEGELWAEPGLETLDRVRCAFPSYRSVDPGTFPAERGRFALGGSKVEVYRECLRALLANLEAAAAGEEPLAVTLEDAAAALQIALRATEAAGARGDPGTIKGMAP